MFELDNLSPSPSERSAFENSSPHEMKPGKRGGNHPAKFPAAPSHTAFACGLEATEGDSLDEVLRIQEQVLRRTLNSMLNQGIEPHKILDELLKAITLVLELHSLGVWSFDPTRQLATLEKTAFHGRVLRDLRQLKHPQAGREGELKSRLIAKALREGPLAIENVKRSKLLDPPLRKWMFAEKVKSIVCVPLRMGEQMIGALTFREFKPRNLLKSRGHVVHALSELVLLALTLSRLIEAEDEAAVLNERGRLAAEIHDSVSQTLSAAAIQLEVAASVLDSNLERVRQHMGLALKMVHEGQEQVRRSVWALPPLMLENRALCDALKLLAGRLNQGTGLRVELKIEGRVFRLSHELESNLFRITQEAVNNALRHANPTNIKILLVFSPRRVELAIGNDGGRFKSEEARRGLGAGLGNMRARSAKIGARFSIHSGRRYATQVRVILPIPAA